MYYLGGGGRFCPATIPPPLIILFWFFSRTPLFHSQSIPSTRCEAHDHGLTNQLITDWYRMDTWLHQDNQRNSQGFHRRVPTGTTRRSLSSFSKIWSWWEPLQSSFNHRRKACLRIEAVPNRAKRWREIESCWHRSLASRHIWYQT